MQQHYPSQMQKSMHRKLLGLNMRRNYVASFQIYLGRRNGTSCKDELTAMARRNAAEYYRPLPISSKYFAAT